ncbi:MAG: Fe(3+) dicitrate transport protein, partial [Myxococcota bacterium]
MMRPPKHSLPVLLTLLVGFQAAAEPPDDKNPDDPIELPPVFVDPAPNDLTKIGGSVHHVGEGELEQLEYDDPNAILYTVPGVYIRQEDGYGLRPNIGLRGTNPERSKKVTLMEDGLLFGPAPYSAPAAYYFPALT